MPTTPWSPVVKQVVNGTAVSAETLNPIFSIYANRTQHLYEAIQEIEDKTVLIAQDESIYDTVNVVVNSVVYFLNDGISTGLALAKASFKATDTNSFYAMSSSAYVYGIVKSIDGFNADIYTHGLIEGGDRKSVV